MTPTGSRALRFAWPLLVFLGLVLVLALGLRRDPRALPSALLDRPVPAFELPVLGDGAGRLSANQLRGQVWVLNVWASWCEPCRAELPALARLAGRDGVSLYGLNYKDKPEQAQALLRVLGNPYRASAVDADGRVGMDFGVQGVPETFVIDARGRVRWRHTGPITDEIWTQRLLPALKEAS